MIDSKQKNKKIIIIIIIIHVDQCHLATQYVEDEETLTSCSVILCPGV